MIAQELQFSDAKDLAAILMGSLPLGVLNADGVG